MAVAEIVKKGKLTISVVSKSGSSEYISQEDKEMDKRAKEAVKAAISKAKCCGKPIAKYDKKNKKAYVEYANGEKKYVQ